MPSSVELRFVERAIIHKLTEKNISMRAIEGQTVKMLEGDLVALRENFDFIIFDCAPGISIFTEVAVRLSDLVVIPTIPDILSTLGLAAFCNSVWRLKLSEKSHLPPPKGKPFVLISRRQATKQQNDTVERLKEEAAGPKRAFGLFKTEIPQSADVPRAMGLYPDNIINPYPTYSRKWGRHSRRHGQFHSRIERSAQWLSPLTGFRCCGRSAAMLICLKTFERM